MYIPITCKSKLVEEGGMGSLYLVSRSLELGGALNIVTVKQLMKSEIL